MSEVQQIFYRGLQEEIIARRLSTGNIWAVGIVFICDL
jgi:hypothetical protein